MKTFEIILSINGDEYQTAVRITCEELERIDNHTIQVDGIPIKFDSPIWSVIEVEYA